MDSTTIEILFNPIHAVAGFHSAGEEDKFDRLVNRAREGIQYYEPELIVEGENGSYFLKDKNGSRIAVWKPCEEEGIASPKRKNKKVDDEDEEDEPRRFQVLITIGTYSLYTPLYHPLNRYLSYQDLIEFIIFYKSYYIKFSYIIYIFISITI